MLCWNCQKGVMKVVTDTAGHEFLKCECGATANTNDKVYKPKRWRGRPLEVVKKVKKNET